MDEKVCKAGVIQQEIQCLEFYAHGANLLIPLQLPLGNFRAAPPLPPDAAGRGKGQG